MKRVFAIGLSLMMLFALLPLSVLGAEDDGLTKAILTAKERIAVPENYTEFTSETQEADGVTYYILSWSPVSDGVSYQGAIHVRISDRGDILSYQKSGIDRSRTNQFSKYTGEEMRDLAYAWLEKVNPQAMAEFPIENAEFPEGYSVSSVVNIQFERIVAGLPFCNNYFNVMVNTQTGEIESMNGQYTYYQELPAADAVLGQEEAREKFFENNPVSVEYVTSSEENRAVLVYAPKDSGFEMNAVTGEEVTYEDELLNYAYDDGYAEEEAPQSAGGKSASRNKLTESELKNVEQVDGLLSKDALVSMVQGLENTGFAGLTAESVDYRIVQQEGKEDRYYAEVYLTGGRNARVWMDAKTGELLSFYGHREGSVEEEDTLDRKAVETAAAAFAEKYAKEAFAKTRLDAMEIENMPEDYVDSSASFVRYENDIPYDSNSLRVQVDLVTGEIVSFYKNWTEEMTFEDPAGLVGEDIAKAALLGEDGLTLKYINRKRTNGLGEIVLAYVLDRYPALVGGTSGQLVNYDGSPYDETAENAVLPEDMAGHYGETAVNMLIQTGILSLEEGSQNFRPDDVITQKELLAFVSGMMYGSVPYPIANEDALRIALRYGILSPEEYQPEKEACRLDGVEYILHALDYAEIAELKGIYDSGFADRGEMAEKEGYAALAKGLGIVNGDENGYFLPYAPLTRADAAIMMYNYFMRG